MKHYTFKISEIEPLIAHTLAAAEHHMLYGLPETEAPALWLCLDPTAVFLSSNGDPPLRDVNGHSVVAYAIGCGLEDHRGGDGRCELVPSADIVAGIERAEAVGRDTLTVQMGPTTEIIV